ncbi:MAG: YceI family protein [endosymbiont of Escarpia spicata]|uniref:YceI family protein n=1 Tax=endosymbiont of Escarpia spicata TaxID=2200908 RepID=A0A370DR43_9GAMM|nr:MAG: YceI family protein [endosymbiont of Escarpia spicata]
MKSSCRISFLLLSTLLPLSGSLYAADYVIDTKGSHASIQFKIPHLGYSLLLGRFNKFSGKFSYDEKNPSNAGAEVIINTASVDSNHAERDKHLRSEDFLFVERYPEARFVSTGYHSNGDNTGILNGNLTLRGVTKPISIDVRQIGAGKDPWGGFRRGFEGHTKLKLSDYNINFNIGPASKEVELGLYLEGIRQ